MNLLIIVGTVGTLYLLIKFSTSDNASLADAPQFLAKELQGNRKQRKARAALEKVKRKEQKKEVAFQKKVKALKVQPVPQRPKAKPRWQETIFVGIPALDDLDCSATVSSLFKAAQHPERVFVGLYEQKKQREYDCLGFLKSLQCPSKDSPEWSLPKFKPKDAECWAVKNAGILRVEKNMKNSRGPTHARWMAEHTFYKGEDFIMMTDSHTRFIEGWDTEVLKQWHTIKNPYAILSHYPKGIDQMSNDERRWAMDVGSHPGTYHVCGSLFEYAQNHYMPRNSDGCYANSQNVRAPVLTPFWCAGFSFSPKIVRDIVPWDNHSAYLFWGEEYLHGSRLFTHGFDVYAPNRDIVYHRYNQDDNSRRGNINDLMANPDFNTIQLRSLRRVNYLWGTLQDREPGVKMDQVELKEIDKYSLGKRRTLKQFWDFVGLDPAKKSGTVWSAKAYEEGGFNRIPWVSKDPLNQTVFVSNEKYRTATPPH